MKNIQVIDGANNCTYDIFGVPDVDFDLIFPDIGQDVEFADDFAARVGETIVQTIFERLWGNQMDKKTIQGIHGTLFFELEFKKKYYPTKRESEMIVAL